MLEFVESRVRAGERPFMSRHRNLLHHARLEFAQPLHLAATAQAFGEVTFTRVLGCVERAVDVPRQQRLGLAFRRIVIRNKRRLT